MTTNSEQSQGENLVEEVRGELVEIDAMQINDHGDRYEQLHQNYLLHFHPLMGCK